MKILCFIDSLGSGGAQRQLATLAVGLKKRGHQIRFLVYHQEDHFLPLLEEAGIDCQIIPPCSYWRRVLAVRRILRIGWQDVVLAFLEVPCFCAELAGIPGRRWGLVAGERLADPKIFNGRGRRIRHFHRFADIIVSNSHTNRLILQASFPFLKKKLITVYNTVDLQLFRPQSENNTAGNAHSKPLRIIVAAGYHEKKNMMGVAKALLILKKNQCNPSITVDWFGAVQVDPAPFKRAVQFVAENGLSESFRFNRTTQSINEEFSRADGVGIFSFYEGLPNAVCEGMACGKPILLSNVCDAGNLVKDGINGFLCDPASPESIALAMDHFSALGSPERQHMGVESRRMAEELFDENIVIERYEKILSAAVLRKPVQEDCSWPSETPESAVRTTEGWASA